jgi:hypothetical protein
MMLSRFLPLLFIFFSGCLHAYEFPIEIIEFMDNNRVAASINEADIDKSVDWVPFESAPPLSVAEVLKAIKDYLAERGEMTNAILDEVELKRIPHHEKHWHYLVKLHAPDEDRQHSSYFFVLMTGKVIPGVKQPQSVK